MKVHLSPFYSVVHAQEEYTLQIELAIDQFRTSLLPAGANMQTEYTLALNDANVYHETKKAGEFLQDYADAKQVTIDEACTIILKGAAKSDELFRLTRKLRIDAKGKIKASSSVRQCWDVLQSVLTELDNLKRS